MQKIKLYTKGIHSYIMSIDPDWLGLEIKTDGFNLQFGEDIQTTLQMAHVATVILTTDSNETHSQTIHYTIGDNTDLMFPANPFIDGGEYFANQLPLEDGDAVVIGSIRDWRDPISEINLDIDEEIDPEKLHFCTISLKPFFKQQGIMGIVYADLNDQQKELLASGSFYDPNEIAQMFPEAIIAPVEYNLNVDKWYFELYTGKVHKNGGQFSFEQVSDKILVPFEDYEKATSPDVE